MWEDPIVEETRKLRELLADEVGDDLRSIYEHFKEREARSTAPVVSLPPRRPVDERRKAS